MIPFYAFALGLCGGLTAQAVGLWRQLRQASARPRLVWPGRLWLAGVLLILVTAAYDRDALLFCGQLLAAILLRRWIFAHA